jgi:dephospho-CoA kinase
MAPSRFSSTAKGSFDVASQTKAVIGLTGGIASGKSSVGRALSARGVQVVDADQLARDVVVAGSEGLAEIVRAFGDTMLRADGSLDRERLGARVFHDPEARKHLNAITHPRIARLSGERIATAMQTASPYVVYEAALLVETGAHRGLSALLVVAAAPEVQLARMMARDGLDETAAQARLAAQAPLEAKLAAANYVIHNDTDLSELERQIERVHAELCQRFAVQPPDTAQ